MGRAFGSALFFANLPLFFARHPALSAQACGDRRNTHSDFWCAEEDPIVNGYEFQFCDNAAELYYDLQSGLYCIFMRNEQQQISWKAEDVRPRR